MIGENGKKRIWRCLSLLANCGEVSWWIFVRNAYLESAENSVLETTLKPFALIFCVCSTYIHSMHSGYNGVISYYQNIISAIRMVSVVPPRHNFFCPSILRLPSSLFECTKHITYARSETVWLNFTPVYHYPVSDNWRKGEKTRLTVPIFMGKLWRSVRMDFCQKCIFGISRQFCLRNNPQTFCTRKHE